MMLFDMIHFERPYWLLFIPVTLLIAFLFNATASQKSALESTVDTNLLKHLEYKNHSSNKNKWLGVISLILCWIGLAGISWTQVPTEMFESTQKNVLVVDQSLSMYATDILPNRQTQLKQTIRDILEQTKEGDIALVAFAGEGFVISPFSQDRETITHFLLALEPIIMPVYGSNLSSGIETALSLNQDTSTPLHIIVLTDDLSEEDKERIPSLLKGANTQLDLIAVGTTNASPIKLPDGQIMRQNGRNVIAATPIDKLEAFTQSLGGQFYEGRLTPNQLAQVTHTSLDNQQTQKSENKSIYWQEQGHWFALPLLLWLAFQFRKGMLFILLIGVFSLPSEKSFASPLDWFLTPDQKGQQAVDQGDWQTADQYFTQPDWKAASSYALKNYQETIESLRGIERNASENYNLGNAFALSGDVSKAIEAYEKALEQDPTLVVAKENLDYLKKQEQKKNEQNDESQDQNSQDQNQSSNQSENQENQQSSSDSNEKNEPNDSSESKNDNKKNETEDKEKSPKDNKQEADSQSEAEKKETADSTLDKEQNQALNQWLRQIQDDPGLLLQRKLWYLHQEKRNENRFTQKDGQNPW